MFTISKKLKKILLLTIFIICGFVFADGQEGGIRLLFPTGHLGAVKAVSFSPDGRIVASAGDDRSIKLWSLSNEVVIHSLTNHSAAVEAIDFSPDGKILASASGDKSVRLWRVSDGSEIANLNGHTQTVSAVKFSPDGKRLVSGGSDGVIRIWDAAAAREIFAVKPNHGEIKVLAFSPDGAILASGSRSGTIRFWDLAANREIKSFKAHSYGVNSIAFSPDGKLLAGGGGDNLVKIWDVVTAAEVKSFAGHSDFITSVAWSADGKTIASGSFDKTVKMWNAASGSHRTVPEQFDPVNSIAFKPNSDILASADVEGKIVIWNTNSNNLVKTLAGQTAPLGSLALSFDNKLLAVGGADKTVKFWDLENGQLLHSLAGHEKAISAIAFSPNNKTAASGGWDSSVKLWDARAGTEIKTLVGHISVVDSLCFSPDGKTLASSSSDNTIKFWDVESGKLINSINVQSKLPYFSITFSPDGKYLAGGHFYEYTVWDAATKEVVFSNRQQSSAIANRYSVKDRIVKYTPPGTRGVNALFSVLNGNSVAFSPDGKTLMVRQSTGLMLLDAATGVKKINLEGDFWQVKSFSFSPDGKFLIGGGERDGIVKIWDAATGNIVSQLLERSAGGVSALAVVKNGKNLINTSRDGLVRIFDLSAGKMSLVLTTLGENEWAVASADGFFEASPKAEKKLAYAFRSEIIGAEQLRSRFFTERLLAKTINGEKLPQNVRIELYPLVTVKTSGDNLKSGNLQIKLVNQGGGIGRVQVLVNGKEFTSDARPAGFNPNVEDTTITIDVSRARNLSTGQSKISVAAFNAAGDLANRNVEINW